MPKSIAVAYPERVALTVAAPMVFLDRLLAPPVWLVNAITRLILRPFGIQPQRLAPVVSEEEPRRAGSKQARSRGVIEEGREGDDPNPSSSSPTPSCVR